MKIIFYKGGCDQSVCIFFFLAHDQSAELPFLVDQFFKSAHFRQPSMFYHDDPVATSDGGHPMGDYQLAALQILDILIYAILRLFIESRCGLVHDEEVRFSDEGSSNCNSLFLSSWEEIAFGAC